MKAQLTLLVLPLVLHLCNGFVDQILNEIKEQCLLTPKAARTVYQYMSPWSALDALQVEDINPDDLASLRGVAEAFPAAKDTALTQLVENDGHLPPASQVYGALYDSVGDWTRRLQTEPEPETSPPLANDDGILLDDWQQCAIDNEYFTGPFFQALDCAKSVVEQITKPIRPPPIRVPTIAVQVWALRMLDASFKPPTGIAQGKLHWPGDYEQCNGISATYEMLDGQNRTVNGRYCRANVGLIPTSKNNESMATSVSLALGVCVPSTCATENITSFINTGDFSFDLLNKYGLEVRSIFCGHDLDMDSDPRGQLALSITVILAIIGLLAAFYDGFFRSKLIQKELDNNYVAPTSQLAVPPPEKAATEAANPGIARSVSYVSCHPEDYKRFSSSGEHATPYHQTAPPAMPSMSLSPSVSSTMPLENYFGSAEQSGYLDEPASIKDRFEVAFVGFSFYTSLKNIFAPRFSGDYFRSCDSVRFLSFCFAMLGMTYVLGIIYTETWTAGNLVQLLELKKLLYFQPVLNFTLCVDSFLVISGLLVTYNWMKRVEKNDGKMSWRMVLHFYLHRYWSFMPAFMLVLTFYTCLYKYFTHGPMTPPLIEDAENCRENWWTNLLMINNLVNPKHACMSWTWYIPMVFQLHIVTPLIIFPLTSPVKFIGYVFWVVMFVVHVAVTALIADGLYQTDGILDLDKWLYGFVMVPWTKAGSYFIGIALGFALFKLRGKKIKIHPVVVAVCWAAAITTVTAVACSTWGMLNDEHVLFIKWSKAESISIRTLGHTAWGLSIAWMIFASETGHGGILRSFLRYKAFGPLARMTFMAFLVSAIFVIRNTLVQVSLIYVTLNNMLYFLCGNLFISVLAGLFLGLVFQRPFMGIEKAFLLTTKREAFMVASNPLEDIGEGGPANIRAPPVHAVPTVFDNVAYASDSPPPAYKRFSSSNGGQQVHTTPL